MRTTISLTLLIAGALLPAACSSPAPAPPPPPAAAPAPAPDPAPPPEAAAPAEPEIALYAYSDQQGWRAHFQSWQPTTVYEFNGHYYPHSINGARAVQVYRDHDTYFTPPPDRAWNDKRFDPKQRPTEADLARARPRPHP